MICHTSLYNMYYYYKPPCCLCRLLQLALTTHVSIGRRQIRRQRVRTEKNAFTQKGCLTSFFFPLRFEQIMPVGAACVVTWFMSTVNLLGRNCFHPFQSFVTDRPPSSTCFLPSPRCNNGLNGNGLPRNRYVEERPNFYGTLRVVPIYAAWREENRLMQLLKREDNELPQNLYPLPLVA